MALNTAREVGHVRLECIVLCNLGILLTSEGRLLRRRSIWTMPARLTSDRRAEARPAVTWRVLAKQGLIEEARDMATRRSLCGKRRPTEPCTASVRAEIELLASDPEAAERAASGSTHRRRDRLRSDPRCADGRGHRLRRSFAKFSR